MTFLSYEFEYRAAEPPGESAISNYGDAFVSAIQIQGIIRDDRLRQLEERVLDLEDRVSQLERENGLIFEDGGVWDELVIFGLKMIASSIFGNLMEGVANRVQNIGNRLSNALGHLQRQSTNVILNTVSSKNVNSMLRETNLPRQSMSNLTARGISFRKNSGLDPRMRERLTTVNRPYNENGMDEAQHLDVSEKLDVTIDVKMNGRPTDELNVKQIQDQFVTNAPIRSEELLPKMYVHYEPLGVLPKPLANSMHQLTTNSDLSRRMKNTSTNITIRKPSHAFTTVVDYEKVGNRRYINKTIIGVGELNMEGKKGLVNRSGKVGIGGVQLKYEVMQLRGAEGGSMVREMSWEEIGYSEESVNNMYRTLLKGRTETTTDGQWRAICNSMNSKIMKSDIMGQSYIPDTAKTYAVKSLASGEIVMSYNLLHNNCQQVVLDLLRYIRGESISDRWNWRDISKIFEQEFRELSRVTNTSIARLLHMYKDESQNLFKILRTYRTT